SQLSEAELLIGRALDVIGYDVEEFAARARSGNGFILRVLAEPKEWVRGSPEALALAEAA
ncbi:MAG TPA: hypothetical protein VFX98_13600, partial [Longimicrobiaceae bacterium]|nr:hypothetical protein [Longimicrobiaceae bacterium]